MPDSYTTTNDPLREMICGYCKGNFVGMESTNLKYWHNRPILLCDNCIKSARDA